LWTLSTTFSITRNNANIAKRETYRHGDLYQTRLHAGFEPVYDMAQAGPAYRRRKNV
jgi:hypothetical protein